MADIVQKAVSQSFPFMSAGNQACYIQQLDWNGASAVLTAPVVRFAFVGEIIPLTGAIDLEIADGALRQNRGEPEIARVDKLATIRDFFLSFLSSRLRSF
jgi:hypothetical protein